MSDSIEIRFNWQCPYCGFKNSSITPVRGPYAHADVRLVYCDVDSGGCDTQVAVQPHIEVATTVYKLIEDDHPSDEPRHYPAQVDPALEDYRKYSIPGESMAEYEARKTTELDNF